jgi:L-asparaginase II
MNAKTAGPVPLVEVYRGGRLECVHFGCIAVCDTKGQVLFARGDPELATYLRSSAKPFQASTVVKEGAAKRWALTDAELAVVCASHGGQPLHLEAVQSILKKCGVAADALLLGPHEPSHTASAIAMHRAGKQAEKLHNNCSGKHAGMLATSRHKSWPIDEYLKPDHPVQVANRANLAAFAGMKAEDIPSGIDGCGVPSFYLQLTKLATAYARLANAKARPQELGEAGEAVVRAMTGNPVHIAHEGQFGALLLQHAGKHVVAKGGAEGVFAGGLIGRDVGIAFKISDGTSRAIPFVMLRLLEQFLHEVRLEELKKATLKPILNTRGQEVGELKVVGF